MVLRSDLTEVAVEDVKVGDDTLCGPDGKPRQVLTLSSGKERLYRIKMNSWRDDLVVTGNHPLMLQETQLHHNNYSGPDLAQSKRYIEETFGPLPELSSDPGDPTRPLNKVRKKGDFWTAFRHAIKYSLDFPRGEHSLKMFANRLVGVQGIREAESCYHVMEGLKRDVFYWNQNRRSAPDGEPGRICIGFDTKDEAFAAAKDRARETRQNGETIYNLKTRFLEKKANGKGGKIMIDKNLPNVVLKWQKERLGLTGLRSHHLGEEQAILRPRIQL